MIILLQCKTAEPCFYFSGNSRLQLCCSVPTAQNQAPTDVASGWQCSDSGIFRFIHACIRICGGRHALSILIHVNFTQIYSICSSNNDIHGDSDLHSLCCLGWSISWQSRQGLGPNAAARFHTLRIWWRKKKLRSHTRGGWHLYTNVMRIAVHIVQICTIVLKS